MVSKCKGCLMLVAVLVFVVAGGLVLHSVYLSSRGNPVAKTKHGLISGLRATDGDYSMFKGIPFAKVNETIPFGQALPNPPFDGIFNAHDDSVKSPQIESYNNTLVGTLDCLRLNIHVPNSASAANRLSVLVYFYGGRHEEGFPGRYVYGPKFLVKHDIIVVTPNYRLGPYGFFCLHTPEVPGNQGLKDQVMALRWIKNNIEAFGGDRNKITIAGGSSSGQDVDLHIMYGEEGLFNNAIIGAGTIFNSVSVTPTKIAQALAIAEDLGLNISELSKALTFLSKQDPNSVIASSINKLGFKYRPCLERELDDVEIFINEYPKTSEIRNIKSIPVIIGLSNQESMSHLIHKDFDDVKDRDIFRNVITETLNIKEDKLESVVNYVRQFYIGDKKISNAVKQQIIDFSSHTFQNYPLKRKIEQYLKNNANKIYFSMFSYNGRRNFLKILHNIDLDTAGAAHVDEIGYLFDVSYFSGPITPDDQLIIDRMTMLDPIPETSELLPIKWKQGTYESMPYLYIDLNLSMGYAPFYDRMKFWDSLVDVNQTL